MTNEGRLWAACPNERQHAQLARYLNESSIPATAYFDEQRKCYGYRTEGGGVQIHCGGLIETLRARFYPQVDARADFKKQRRKRCVKVCGSSSKTGKRIDAQLMHYVAHGKHVKRVHKWTRALAAHWHAMGHSLQVAQLPVVVAQWNKLTQADILTSDKSGALWLWEVKTGMPIGGYRKHGKLLGYPDVDCTKYNQWQLQLHYTRKALEESAELPIAEARIIQIWSEKGEEKPVIKVHEQAKWILPLPPKAAKATKKPVQNPAKSLVQNPAKSPGK